MMDTDVTAIWLASWFAILPEVHNVDYASKAFAGIQTCTTILPCNHMSFIITMNLLSLQLQLLRFHPKALKNVCSTPFTVAGSLDHLNTAILSRSLLYLASLGFIIYLSRNTDKHYLHIAILSGRHASSTPLTLSKNIVGCWHWDGFMLAPFSTPPLDEEPTIKLKCVMLPLCHTDGGHGKNSHVKNL